MLRLLRIWKSLASDLRAQPIRTSLILILSTLTVASALFSIGFHAAVNRSADVFLDFIGRTSVLSLNRAYRGEPLSSEDVNAIRGQYPDLIVSGVAGERAKVISGHGQGTFLVLGTDPEYWDIDHQVRLVSGRVITERDFATTARVCVLSEIAAERLMGGQSPVGDRIRVEGTPFTVVGVAERNLLQTAVSTPSPVVWIPVSTASRTFDLSGLSFISFQPRLDNATEDIAREIEQLVATRRRLTGLESPVVVQTPQRVRESFMRSTRTLRISSVIVSAVIFLLSAVLIANVLLLHIAERTAEIGLRRAVGATRARIAGEILSTVVLLWLFAYPCGIGAGVAAFKAIMVINHSSISENPFHPLNHLELDALTLALAMFVLLLVTVVAAALPAARAVRLEPVTALREGH